MVLSSGFHSGFSRKKLGVSAHTRGCREEGLAAQKTTVNHLCRIHPCSMQSHKERHTPPTMNNGNLTVRTPPPTLGANFQSQWVFLLWRWVWCVDTHCFPGPKHPAVVRYRQVRQKIHAKFVRTSPQQLLFFRATSQQSSPTPQPVPRLIAEDVSEKPTTNVKCGHFQL